MNLTIGKCAVKFNVKDFCVRFLFRHETFHVNLLSRDLWFSLSNYLAFISEKKHLNIKSLTYTCDCATVTLVSEFKTANLHPIASQFSFASFHSVSESQSKSLNTNSASPTASEPGILCTYTCFCVFFKFKSNRSF